MSIKDYFVAKQREIERKKRMETAGKVGLGLAIGSFIGSAAGVLLAPKSGKETREDIKATAYVTKEQLKAKGEELTTNVQDTYHTAVNKFSTYGEEKLTQLKNVKDDVEDTATELKVKAADKVEEVAKDVKSKAAETAEKAADKVEKTAGKVEKEADKVEAKAKAEK